ncbi:MAG: hypothetical protein WBH77_07040 [Saccharofermentanales bacterium]
MKKLTVINKKDFDQLVYNLEEYAVIESLFYQSVMGSAMGGDHLTEESLDTIIAFFMNKWDKDITQLVTKISDELQTIETY